MFTIVKHASATHWEYFFTENPVDGVGIFCSAHNTESGKLIGLQEQYADLQEAEADCLKMNTHNPSGGYAVCPVVHKQPT